MTREEAIKILQGAIKKPNTKDGYLGQAIDMAIKALEQEPCDDCVSREFMYKLGAKCIAVRNENDVLVAIASIESLPPVTSQPKVGRWIDRFPTKECKCSVCDFLICISNGSYIDMVGQMKYCPNCGAKMEEVKE